MDNVLLIIIIILISLGAFWLIKSVCKPIKTLTAVLLVIPTVLTCGVVLFIYRAFKNSYVSTSSNISSSNKYSTDFYDVNDNSMGSEDKKPARAYDDGFGKTTYYDKEGNLMGASLDNGFGKETFTDSEGNYVGSSSSDIYDNVIFIIRPYTYYDVSLALGSPDSRYEKVFNYKDKVFWSFDLNNYRKSVWWKKSASSSVSGFITIRTANTVRKVLEIYKR